MNTNSYFITGTLRLWTSRGYGFVQTTNNDGAKTDWFVHISNVKSGTAVQGCHVEFTPGEPTGSRLAPALNVWFTPKRVQPAIGIAIFLGVK